MSKKAARRNSWVLRNVRLHTAKERKKWIDERSQAENDERRQRRPSNGRVKIALAFIVECATVESVCVCIGLVGALIHSLTRADWLRLCVEKMGAASIIHKMIRSEGVMCCWFFQPTFFPSFVRVFLSCSLFVVIIVVDSHLLSSISMVFLNHFFHFSKTEVANMWTTCCFCVALLLFFSLFLSLSFILSFFDRRFNFIGPKIRNFPFLCVLCTTGTFQCLFIYFFVKYDRVSPINGGVYFS